MLGLTRRRVLSGVGAAVISGALVLSVAPPVSATPVVVAPLIPEVAADVGAAVASGCAATGPGCAIVAAGALAYSAWWLYNNQDTMLGWMDSTLGQAQQSAGAPASGGVWALDANTPSPSGGPVTRTGGDAKFEIVCQNAVCNQPTVTAKCIATNGVVTAGTYVVGGSTSAVGSVGLMGGFCVSPSMVGEVQATYNGGTVYWHASGSWDSVRTTTVTYTCKTPGGTSTVYTSTTTATVTSMTRATVVPPCPTGTYTSKVLVSDGAGSASATRVAWQSRSTTESTFPNCFSGSSPGFGGCLLVVKYLGTACDETVAACQYWWTSAQTHWSDYSCMWGPYAVPLSSCRPMMYAYVPGNGVDSTTLLPAVQTAPTPTPTASATTGGGTQATTGTNPLPSPSASASGWVSAQPFPQPTGTATPVPEPPAVVGPTPGQSNCMDAIWGWNPINWVVVPVECALTWAFVPDGAVMQQTVSDMGNHWHASATGTFVDGAFGMFATLGNLTAGDAQACGLVVDFPYAHGHTQEIRLLDSCTPPMSTYAPWVKGFLTAMLLFDGIYACVRALGIGFGIGVPPKMGQLDLFSQN